MSVSLCYSEDHLLGIMSRFFSVWSVALRVHRKLNYRPKMAAQSQKWRVISFILSMCDYMVSVRKNISLDLNTTAIVCKAQPVIYTGVRETGKFSSKGIMN